MVNTNLKHILAQNLAAYRKLNNLTQAELAEKINYSDKSVSKWERGEGFPDIQVLSTLSELYGVKVDDFLNKQKPKRKLPAKGKRILVPLLSAGLVWLVATLVFFILSVVIPEFKYSWLGFIYAMPVSAIVFVIFMELWGTLVMRFISASAVVWGLALSIHLSFPTQNIYLIYIVAMVLELLALFWYILRYNLRENK